MKKYNFLHEPPDDDDLIEMNEGSTGRLSPGAKRLLVIGIIGIVLAGGLYVYTTYFTGAPAPATPPPLALTRQPPQPAPPPPKAEQPGPPQQPFRPVEVREEAVTTTRPAQEPTKPPAAVTAPPQVKTEAAVSPKKEEPAEKPAKPVGAQPEQQPAAKKAEGPSKPPAAARTPAEKPAPQMVAKAPTPQVAGEKQYAVQVASLVQDRNVLALKKRLEELGYSPDIRKVTTSIMHHRVVVGEFTTREEAEGMARKLNVDGFPSNVVSIKGGKFAPEVGSFVRLNTAIDLAHDLQKKNYPAKIISDPATTPVHQVRVGTYPNREEAAKTLEALKKKGFEPLIVRR